MMCVKLVAGVDEVGRGPLAGPVLTAAVILKEPIMGVTDSKKITPLKREKLAVEIQEQAIAYAYGRAEVEEVEMLNIHRATLLAMQRAILALPIKPDYILVDGLFMPSVEIPGEAVVKGDLLRYEIGAASILAKVARDQEMVNYDTIYPGYGFAQHKGYGTALHRAALLQLGPCAIHRKTFIQSFMSTNA